MTVRSALGLAVDPETRRRLWRALRVDPGTFAVPADPDPDRLALVSDPFSSAADVAERLGRLESQLLAEEDRRAVFLTVYAEMTAHTIDAVEVGAFEDAEWTERYLVTFAEYYRWAFEAFERGAYREVPDPWMVAFGTAARGDALVVQDAFLGINAHIGYDLALTLTDVGIDPDRPRKYADHRHVDAILARLVRVQRELLAERYAPGLSRVGAELRGLDERWSASTLRAARETAWRTAVVRTDARWTAVDRYTRWVLSRAATGGAGLLLSPAVDPKTMRALRDVEADRFDLASYARTFHERATEMLSTHDR